MEPSAIDQVIARYEIEKADQKARAERLSAAANIIVNVWPNSLTKIRESYNPTIATYNIRLGDIKKGLSTVAGAGAYVEIDGINHRNHQWQNAALLRLELKADETVLVSFLTPNNTNSIVFENKKFSPDWSNGGVDSFERLQYVVASFVEHLLHLP